MKRFTKQAMLATVALLIVVSTAGCTSNTGNQTPSAGGSIIPSASSNMATHANSDFTISYPSDWEHNPTTTATGYTFLVVPSRQESASMQIISQKLAGTMTLSDWVDLMISGVQDVQKNYTQIEAANTTLAGNPAYKFVYTATVENNAMKTMYIWTIKEGKLYTIIYGAYASSYDIYADAVQQMIDSLQIK